MEISYFHLRVDNSGYQNYLLEIIYACKLLKLRIPLNIKNSALNSNPSKKIPTPKS